MWTWSDFDNQFFALDEIRRRFDRLLGEMDRGGRPETTTASTFPRVNLFDGGKELIVQADVPGVAEKDIQLTATAEMLAIAGERKTQVPEGYAVHRQERGGVRFSRSFALPTRIDPERVTATVKNGMLTVTLPKAPESQPRQISIKAH